MLGQVTSDAWQHLRYAAISLRRPSTLRLGNIVVPLSATRELNRVRRRVYSGIYEKPERLAIEAMVKSDDVVLEIGAGLGIVSATIASMLGDSGRLVTYEANPGLKESILAVARVNGFSYRPQIASLGAEAGEIAFYLNDATFESSSGIDRGLEGQKKVTVPQHSLKDVFEEIKPTVLVIDIEGGELEALSMTFPASLRAICAEFHPHIVGDRAISRLVRDILNQNFEVLLDMCDGRVLAFQRSG